MGEKLSVAGKLNRSKVGVERIPFVGEITKKMRCRCKKTCCVPFNRVLGRGRKITTWPENKTRPPRGWWGFPATGHLATNPAPRTMELFPPISFKRGEKRRRPRGLRGAPILAWEQRSAATGPLFLAALVRTAPWYTGIWSTAPLWVCSVHDH